MAPVLGYWNLRGLAQPIRLFLEYLGEDYEERLYGRDDIEKWQKEKFTLGLELPNLPYYIDGDVKISQSLAIIRYIADKNKLLGNDPNERAKISMLEGAALDIRTGVARIAYRNDFQQLKVEFLEKLPSVLRMWSDYLKDKQYLMGSSVTHPDFILYEAFSVLKYLDPHCLDAYPNLSAFQQRIESLPRIKAYMCSDKFIKWPLHGWMATFGGGDSPPSV